MIYIQPLLPQLHRNEVSIKKPDDCFFQSSHASGRLAKSLTPAPIKLHGSGSNVLADMNNWGWVVKHFHFQKLRSLKCSRIDDEINRQLNKPVWCNVTQHEKGDTFEMFVRANVIFDEIWFTQGWKISCSCAIHAKNNKRDTIWIQMRQRIWCRRNDDGKITSKLFIFQVDAVVVKTRASRSLIHKN